MRESKVKPELLKNLLEIKMTQDGHCERVNVGKIDKIRVGVLFSGGPAPGGHNVLAGIYDALEEIADSFSLIGFIEGPLGLLKNSFIEIDRPLIETFFNKGGFDALCTSRKKIETEEEFLLASKNIEDLHGLIIIGGDDSNTNALLLHRFIRKIKNNHTCLIGVPKTIDNDLLTKRLTQTFGFSTAVELYSTLVKGLICDAKSTRKYWHFVRLMGRSASHITLATSINARPDLTFISEEMKAEGWGFSDVIRKIVSLIKEKRSQGSDFGVILFPEGLIEQFSELNKLLEEICLGEITKESEDFYQTLPASFRNKLTGDRDEHGNINISKIPLEELIIEATKEHLENDLSAISHFYGYEARCIDPNSFDQHYCYYLGQVAALSIKDGLSGFMAILEDIDKNVFKWRPGTEDLEDLVVTERRKGVEKHVIRKSLVDINSEKFKRYKLLQ